MASTLPDARLDTPFLYDAFDFPQHSGILKTRNLTTDGLRHRVHGRALFGRHGSPGYRTPTVHRKSRNASEPQLMSSTSYTRKSLFFPASHTVGDIASLLSSEDDMFASIRSSQTTALLYDTPDVLSFDNDDLQKIPRTSRADLSDILWNIETSDYRSEESLYSMGSADHDAHPFLLSMPVIPQIKLERKATVRRLDSSPSASSVRHQTFLSPRIPDLRTPARMSSRRYGRILSPPGAPAVFSSSRTEEHGVFQVPEYGSRSRSNPQEDPKPVQAYRRSASEPMLGFSCSDDERDSVVEKEIDDSPNSDLLLSMIDEVGSAVPRNDNVEQDVREVHRSDQVPPPRAKRNHQRSSMSHSISLSGIFHAVSDRCASLDQLLRRPKAKSKSRTAEHTLTEPQSVPTTCDTTSKWAPKEGLILIKVFVPSMDDIWMFRVPQDINLIDFTSRVVTKLGFVVSFSGSVWDEPKYHFRTDEQFKPWVERRIRSGRNLPIVAHVLAPLSLVRLSVDADGCEVWCYA